MYKSKGLSFPKILKSSSSTFKLEAISKLKTPNPLCSARHISRHSDTRSHTSTQTASMPTILSQMSADQKIPRTKRPVPLPKNPKMFRTKYSSLPVSIPDSFLTPLSPVAIAKLKVDKIDFASSVLPEYHGHYAVVIDGAVSQDECDELIKYAEMSAGGHGNGNGEDLSSFQALKSRDAAEEEEQYGTKENGWHRALVRVGAMREMLSLEHRDSDRIIWSNQAVATRIWERVLQAPGVEEDLGVLEGEKYTTVMGEQAVEREERWKLSERGCNESLKFLRYGKGQYFREHCDGMSAS